MQDSCEERMAVATLARSGIRRTDNEFDRCCTGWIDKPEVKGRGPGGGASVDLREQFAGLRVDDR